MDSSGPEVGQESELEGAGGRVEPSAKCWPGQDGHTRDGSVRIIYFCELEVRNMKVNHSYLGSFLIFLRFAL